jgi:heme-degrading monooxygenase HmoA
MAALVKDQPGFIEFVSARDPVTRLGITVAYFTDEESVLKWKSNIEHLEAQRLGQTSFYESYSVKVAKVYREYEMTQEKASLPREGTCRSVQQFPCRQRDPMREDPRLRRDDPLANGSGSIWLWR